MKFTGQFVGAKLSLPQWTNRLRAVLVQNVEEAARSWLTAVTGRVPIWSGMSQGSLLVLSKLVNGQLVVVPKDGIISRIADGKALGTAFQVYTNDRVEIHIITNVPHYNLQEFQKAPKGGSPSAPWRSLDAGKLAYLEIAKTIRLPRLVLKPIVRRV